MPESSPWDDIAVPGADFNVRQVAAGTAVPCFWGRDASGACLFIVELQGDHAAQYRKNAVTVNGIDVDLRAGDQGQQHLVLALERQVDRDLFEGLCRTLASSLEHATDSASSLAVSLAHIRRWKTFLSGRSQHLSIEEVRGLFAEIVFLTELIDRQMSSSDAVEAFDRKLVAHGYAPLPDYDEPRFVVSDVRSYRVGDGFPRLMRSQLPPGIANVAYDIRLETIAPYKCDEASIFGED